MSDQTNDLYDEAVAASPDSVAAEERDDAPDVVASNASNYGASAVAPLPVPDES